MTRLSPQPVPKNLQEMLKDYPGHIKRLQQQLNCVAEEPRSVSPKFEVAIWMLQGQLKEFIREAQAELEDAREDGNSSMIAMAKEKEVLMFRARSSNGGMKDLHDLWDYFEENKDASQ
ncbi:hypothetical protein [Lysobacter sp. CA196]|uniref:hypothetical protein n=1 Tax=Lysobacter sp. CA196 TaxID=3455606 RepID=UPI003F8D6087